MSTSVTTSALRPLGLGELLDRAVTLSVKYFVPFSLIYVAYAVPLGFVQFFAQRQYTAMIEAAADQLRASAAGHAGGPNALSAAFANVTPDDWKWSLLSFSLLAFVGPLATAALIDATAETYLGRSTTFARAYRVGFSRWLPMIGINLMYGIVGLILYTIVVIVLAVVIFALVAITAASHLLGITIDVVIGIVAVLAVCAAAMLVLLALQMSYFSCVVEGAGFLTAFSRGIGRITSGIGIKRSLLVGLAYILVTVGISLVSLLGEAVVVGLLRSPVLGTIFMTIVTVATASFLTAFLTIFYFDLRVREEGLDLQLAAQAALDRPLETTSATS